MFQFFGRNAVQDPERDALIGDPDAPITVAGSPAAQVPSRADEATFEQALLHALNAPSHPGTHYDTPGHRYENAIHAAIMQGADWAFANGRNAPEKIVRALRIALRHIPARGVNAPGRNHLPAWMAALDRTFTSYPWERTIESILRALRDVGANIEDHAVDRGWEGTSKRVPAIRKILAEERERRQMVVEQGEPS